jgi:hypothetical protein
MIFHEKIKLKVYVNQHDLYQIYKRLHGHDLFCVFFMNYIHDFTIINTVIRRYFVKPVSTKYKTVAV